ncbi:Flavin-containing monooxygenase-like protein [Macrophomina phaseolina MS6]|uniref:Flavin-containing monooxygenase-like protein n=1 Tax=Macrophomina phaseolina (strain MS6) TaxID=1126212 RepID=K2R8B7_MACPH|nr:Flavin-containing monooxygenase-like protein [Macrophomina phaseolina MS6]
MVGPIKKELSEYAYRPSNEGPYADNLETDVLIVGAGFAGVYLLYELRKLGYKTVIYEAGDGFGGTWRWNRYPGARVDSEVPEYELSIPEVYKDWTWTTNYPDFRELRAYFDHVDKVLNVSKDTAFGSVVVDAQFDTGEGKWHVKTADGRNAKSKFLIVAAGFAAKRYVPEWPGIDSFKGFICHSSFWPEEGVDVKGKRCAVIGTGASGVQISQEWGQEIGPDGHLKVFQRTPNLAVPMGKKPLTPEQQNQVKPFYPQLMKFRESCFGGFLFSFSEKNTFEDSPEEREAYYRKLWDHGGFSYWLGNYKDMLFDAKANRAAYDFWAKNQRARIGDPRKRDLLAPLEPPHPFGVKRPCLEQNYYEQFNRENVDVVDISKNPIVEIKPNGILLQDGTLHEVDVIAIATGFDITTGGMTSMGLKSINGTTLKDEWKKAAYTYLGTTVSGYPNMFHLYGPHGPCLLSNGPASIEVQARWIVDAIKQTDRQGFKYINPTPEASKQWKKRINELSDNSLFPTTKSTYMGGSLPGKAFEQVNYAGGIPNYHKEIREVLPSFKGFETVKA